MVDVVITIAGKAAELLVVPIGKHILYPFKYKSNMEELTKQVEKLRDRRDTVQHSVDEAKRHDDEIEKKVEKWLNSVDEFTNGVVKPIIDDQVKAGKLCSFGFCPNLMARYSLSKKAAKTTKDGVDLFGEGKFEKCSYRPSLQKTPSIFIRGYGDFDSRKPIFNDLMDALIDADVNLIGVYGMGGVGKTTLVKRVVGQAIQDKLFDNVVMAEVTETLDIKNIQGQIADTLGLTFQEESLSGRADRLRNRLKKEKRVLLVLDNIWAKLDLEAIGIPLREEEEKRSSQQEEDPKGRNDEQRQCKILFTSRSEAVLSNDMNVEKNFLINILSDEEAGNLFWKTVGDSAKQSDFDTIGIEIVRFCAGLPVAIATIASALKKKSLFDWKDALDQLRRSNPRHIKGMHANVYSAIKLSYDFLDSEEAKSLFLLCCLYNASSNISLDYLLRYCIGFGLFQDVSTLEQGRNRFHTLINHLKASCLLLEGTTNEGVKMHDIIHVVAISIASTEKLMFNIQDVTDLKEMLEEKLPKDSTAICLRYKDVSMLPERLEYPKLKLLFLIMRKFSLQISDAFFEGMKELKVLDMTKIRVLSLPSSLSKLTNLQTLCLDQCQLKNVAIIGELKRLEILCFWGSDIEQLPTQIGQLTRLRLLELSNCSNLKVISPNVISSMTRLEELYMGNSFIRWEVEGQSNASLSELKQLSRLTTLEIHILDAQIMPQDLLIFEKLERYRIIIGDEWHWSDDYESRRRLKLKLIKSVYLGNGVKMLLNRTEDLYLDELKDVKNVLYELNGEGFPQLKHLHVQHGHEIQCIVNSIQRGLCNVFQKLESLFLHNLINLEKICNDQLAAESFGNLRIVNIGKCDKLKHLFSFSMAKNLLKLQEIVVTDCNKLEEIVFNESKGQVHQNKRTSGIQFSQLRTLTLQSLPQLTSFGFKKFTPNTGYQEILTEDELDGCIPSFGQNVLLPSLENLKLSSINIECLWLDQLPAMSSCFPTLTSLTLEECSGNLKFLFSFSMVKSLRLLETFEIRNCKSIEGIIDTEKLSREETTVEFPKLINLQLNGLPNLTQFASGSTVEFPSLTKLSIMDCQKMKAFSSKEIEEINCQDDLHPFLDEKVSFSCLKELKLSELPELLHLWKENSQPRKVFENLAYLEVSGCGNLKTLVPSSVSLQNLVNLEVQKCDGLINLVTFSTAKSFEQLKRMRIIDCKLIEEIIIDMGDEIQDRIVFDQLATLWIENCPNMQTFITKFTGVDMSTSKDNSHTDIQPLFDEKVRLPNLEFLRLDKMDKLKKIWHHQLSSDSFCKLNSFGVNRCHNMLNVIPSNMFGILQKLEELWLTNCSSLYEIFELQASGCGKTQAITATQLEKLVLYDLPKLKHIWDVDSQGLLTCQNLISIQVTGCGSLKSIFPASVGRNLLQLEELCIDDCCMVEEIFSKEEQVDEAVPQFPQLTLLRLGELPRLRSFYPRVHISEWPMLKELQVWNCDKVEVSASNFLSFQVTHEVPLDQPLLLFDKVPLTNLESLGLDWKWFEKEALHEKLPEYSCKLSFLTIEGFHKGADICVFCFLHRLLNLEKLQVYRGFFKGLFLCEGFGCEEKHVEAPSKLSHLRLVKLNDSLHLWEENSLSSKGFQNLAILEVVCCSNLKSLVPSSVSFQNLTRLEVLECNELLNLVAVPTAKSLVQLTKLSISECKMIEEIIIHEGDEVKDKIIFKKLRNLELKCLPSLTSFYSGSCTTEFPSLQVVVVSECPNMKIFSLGVLSTPRLQRLQTSEVEDEGFWEGNLNTTIEHLFTENAQSSEET